MSNNKKNIIETESPSNHIEVSGIVVHSSTESLREVEETVNRLIEKHKDFLLMQKERQMMTGYAG